jgi:RNA polymerase sigma factor (sigma-70 family)
MLSPDELLERLRRDPGDRDLLAEMYEHLEPHLRGSAYALAKRTSGSFDDADDLIQDILLYLLKDFGAISSRVSSFKHLQNYLWKSYRNRLVSYHRNTEVRASAQEVVSLRFVEVVSEDVASELEKAENQLLIGQLVEQLGEGCRSLVSSYLLSQQSLADYARERGIKLGSIYTQWRRCLEEMRKILKDHVRKTPPET